MTIAIEAARASTLAALGYENNPFFAWDNIAGHGVGLLGTPTLPDGDRSNAVSGTTYDFWLPDVTATTANFHISIALQTISFVAIAAHNLGTLGASARVQRSVNGGGTWSDAGAGLITPTDDRPLAWRMRATGRDSNDWRIYITGLTPGAPLYIGVAFFGHELIVPSRIYEGFSPAIRPTEVELQSNVSVGGHLLGSSVISKGSTVAPSFEHVPASFVRNEMPGLVDHFNSGAGLFFGWRPEKYPQDLHYCWRQGAVLRPVNTGPKDYMGFSMQMRAHDD